MILKADQIASLLEKKQNPTDPLVIVPSPDVKQLRDCGSASVDLRLGTWFTSFRQNRFSILDVNDPSTSSPPESRMTKRHYVSFGEPFVIHPRNFVLGVTLEWVRLPRRIAGYVVGKSSWGRRGLVIATAVAVHPGFAGCLTLEISNLGEIPIAIKPGMPICQLCFHSSSESASEHIDQSRYIGLRRPALGQIRLDPMAEKLSKRPIP